jgi:hypothetical protein
MKLYDLLFEYKKKYYIWPMLFFENKFTSIRATLSGKNLELFDKVLNISPQLPNKYWKFIANKYKNNNTYTPQQVYKIISDFDDIIEKRHGLGLSNKDINSYSDVKTLENIVFQAKNTISNQQIKKQIKTTENKLIYQDDRFLVVEPLTTNAACYFGKDTKWCISAKEKNQFENYKAQGAKIAIIIDKQKIKRDPLAKIAIAHVEFENIDDSNLWDRYEIYDSADKIKTIEELWNFLPQNILQTINNFYGKILPHNKQEDADFTQSIKSKDLTDKILTLLLHIKSREEKEAEEKLTNPENAERTRETITYLKYILEKTIKLSSNKQLSHLITIYKNYTWQKQEYYKSILDNELLSRIDNMTIEQKINFLFNEMNLPISKISELVSVNIPNTKEFFINFLQTSRNPSMIQYVLHKNEELLKSFIFVENNGHDIHISWKALEMMELEFSELVNSENTTDFDHLNQNAKASFGWIVRRWSNITPSLSKDDEINVAKKIWSLIKNEQLISMEMFPGVRAVVYLPNA